jgi:adenylate cyclase
MHWRPGASKFARATLVLLAAGLALAHASGLWPLGFITRLDLAMTDARMIALMPRTLDPRIVIVDIDEPSLASLGRWPWPRDRVAALAEELFARQQAAVVGFDVLFAEPDHSAGLQALERLASTEPAIRPNLPSLRSTLDFDSQLAQALQGRRAVLGFYLNSEPTALRTGQLPAPVFETSALQGRRADFTQWPGYVANLPRLAAAAPHAGFFNSLPDIDGVVRSVPLVADVAGQHHQSLALAVFRSYTGNPEVEPVFPDAGGWFGGSVGVDHLALVQGSERVRLPLDGRGGARIPFRGPGGPHGGSFTYHSAESVLLGRLPPATLAGKIVLVGSTTPALFDLRPTPVSEVFPGVEVHANLISGLLDGRLPSQPDWARGVEIAQLVLVALAMALWPLRWGAVATLGATAALLASLYALNTWAYMQRGLVLPLASALLLTLVLYGGITIWGHIREGRNRRSLARLFGSYVPPELVKQMALDPERYDMHAENRVLTIMFCDMRNFTRVSEALSPDDLRALVNRFFSTMTVAIRQQRGTLDKYIGDAIMAFWGAPVSDAGHARHAVLAALDMTERLKLLNADLQSRGLPSIGLGIGLNTGLVCVGDMGSDIRRSYTVMGDAVNLASRIEALTRHYGLDLLVGEATRQAAGEAGGLAWLEVDTVRVKGKTTGVTLFTPIPKAAAGPHGFEEESRLWLLAQLNYRKQHWNEAEGALQQLSQLNPSSPFKHLYQHYSERISQYRRTPPPADWDGVHTLDSK